jgi:RNA polymerase sigma factor for flagellar operon FliA
MEQSREHSHDAMITATMPYVRRVAVQIARELPPGVALDDLIAAGQDGLLDAASRWDSARGVRFSTYAHYRIKGAIFDYVRAAAGQSVVWRARVAAEQAVDDVIESRVADAPVTTSVCEAAELLEHVLDDVAVSYTLSEFAKHVTPDEPVDPESQLGDHQHAQHVRSAVEGLPERERMMIQAVYFEGLSIEAAGLAHGYSKSWASRVHARGIELLRKRVNAQS